MNKNQRLTDAFRRYELGKAYKRRIGLYERVRTNERFFRGEQWHGAGGEDLPKPVFNVIRRIVDHLVGSVARTEFSIRYTDEGLPFFSKEKRERLQNVLSVMSQSAAARWENSRMDKKVHRLLYDAAISGDGVIYCWWDPDKRTGQPFMGDIVSEVIDSTNLFVADVNRADIQSQEYVILSGRESVEVLKREARAYGVPEEEVSRIRPDDETDCFAGDLAREELGGDEGAKATYLLSFYRKNGTVFFEKSTRDVVIRSGDTGCTLYPVAYFSWEPTKNSFHGTSPVTALIPNQRYVNRAYAMVMKHLQDTAFSKVIYDKSKIPEWTNTVGEAIAACGGGNISDAVSVVGVGQMQDGYMELIERALSDTKELSGATEVVLGEGEATNTSAILALQESSMLSLRQVRSALLQCIEDLGDIWADMMLSYYPKERMIVTLDGGRESIAQASLGEIRDEVLLCRVEAKEVSRYSAAASQNLLDKLLEGGHISPVEYLKRLPDGAILQRDELIELLEQKAQKDGEDENE